MPRPAHQPSGRVSNTTQTFLFPRLRGALPHTRSRVLGCRCAPAGDCRVTHLCPTLARKCPSVAITLRTSPMPAALTRVCCCLALLRPQFAVLMTILVIGVPPKISLPTRNGCRRPHPFPFSILVCSTRALELPKKPNQPPRKGEHAPGERLAASRCGDLALLLCLPELCHWLVHVRRARRAQPSKLNNHGREFAQRNIISLLPVQARLAEYLESRSAASSPRADSTGASSSEASGSGPRSPSA